LFFPEKEVLKPVLEKKYKSKAGINKEGFFDIFVGKEKGYNFYRIHLLLFSALSSKKRNLSSDSVLNL